MSGQEVSRSSWADCDSARHARDTGQAAVSTPGGKPVSTPRIRLRARALLWAGRQLTHAGFRFNSTRAVRWGVELMIRAFRMGGTP